MEFACHKAITPTKTIICDVKSEDYIMKLARIKTKQVIPIKRIDARPMAVPIAHKSHRSNSIGSRFRGQDIRVNTLYLQKCQLPYEVEGVSPHPFANQGINDGVNRGNVMGFFGLLAAFCFSSADNV